MNYVTGMIQKGLAETYLALGQLDKAKVHIEEAEKIGDEISIPPNKKCYFRCI